MKEIERIAIIDHASHTLYIEDIDVAELREKYNGSEEEYIEENYEFEDGYSWNYIAYAEYIAHDGDPVDLNEAINDAVEEYTDWMDE